MLKGVQSFRPKEERPCRAPALRPSQLSVEEGQGSGPSRKPVLGVDSESGHHGAVSKARRCRGFVRYRWVRQ